MEYNTELTERARAGDIHAFAQLYETIYLDLYRFALYILGNVHDAEDAVSETVISAYEGISRLRKAESFKSWIFTILSNRCRKIIRKRSREKSAEALTKEMPETTGFCAPASDFIQTYVQHQDVRDAFAELKEEERTIVAFSVFGGYSSEEIGRMLRMSAATVRSKKSRALCKMNRMLSEDVQKG